MKISVPIFEISEDVLKDWFKKISISKFTKLIIVFDRTLGSITSKVSKNLKVKILCLFHVHMDLKQM